MIYKKIKPAAHREIFYQLPVNETRHLVAPNRRRAADMADYSSVAPPSSNAGGGMNDAFKDALQRARQVGKEKHQFCIQQQQILLGNDGFLWYLVRLTYDNEAAMLS